MITNLARHIFLWIMIVAPTFMRAQDELSEKDRAKRVDAGKRVEAIATALKSYAEDNDGKLPKRLHLLVPNYLSSPKALEIPDLITSLPKEIPAYLVWMHGAGIEDPDDENQSMIAFSLSEFPGGGRLIIDARFQTWFCGEGRFQDWIHGRRFDDGVVGEAEVVSPLIEPSTEPRVGGRPQ